ncbi:MAG: HlyD family secretion protein, partial [Planctomycetota bacterium]
MRRIGSCGYGRGWLANAARNARGAASPRVIVPALVLTSLVGYSAWYVVNKMFRTSPATFIGSGTLEMDDMELGSRVGGRVVRVLAAEGDAVEPGAVLVELENTLQTARVEEAEAAVASARAQLRLMESGFTDEEKRAATARLAQAKAQLDEALNGPRKETLAASEARLAALTDQYNNLVREADRQANLERQGISTLQVRENIEAQRDVAKQQVIAAQKELAELKAGTRPERIAAAQAAHDAAKAEADRVARGFRSEDVDSARAAVRGAESRLVQARNDLAECVIRAPEASAPAGMLRVELLDVLPGDLVAAGRAIVRVVRLDRVWLRAWVPERFLSKLAVGTLAEVRLVTQSADTAS